MRAMPRFVVRREGGLYAYEKALERAGLTPVAGADEAGRGACAGPLVVAAVVLPTGRRGQVPGLADSKLLTPAARDRGVRRGRSPRAAAWSVVVVPASEVDRLGLHVCNVEGMRRALAQLAVTPSYVLTDGFPVRGAAGAGSRGLEGRPGQRLDRRGVGAGQGDPGPDHGAAARAVAVVRLPRAQGLRHAGAQRRPRRARSVPRAPVLLRQRGSPGPGRRARPGAHRRPVDEGPVRDDEVVDVTAVDYVVDAADRRC